MKTQIVTLEELAEKLNGNLWVKGDMKRIYLDKGHNTKKMSTKTFVWQDEKGNFKVSCRIDCPSQPYQWIQSQEQEVKDSVYEDIEKIIELIKVTLVDSRLTEDEKSVDVKISVDGGEPEWVNEYGFYERYGKYPEDVFEGLPEPVKPEPVAVPEQPKSPFIPEPIKNTDTPTYGVGATIKHGRFGIGAVTAESDDQIEIVFDDTNVGTKKLLKKFITLEFVG